MTPARAAPWAVYVVRCADGTLYTGVARDAARRVREHNGAGGAGAKYTRARRPVALVYAEKAKDRSAAQKREAAIKRLGRGEKEAMISRKAARTARAKKSPPAGSAGGRGKRKP